MSKYKYLALSGGGIKGVSLVGATKKLIDDGLIDLKTLYGVSGTSAGAMFAILIAIGWTIDEIWKLIMDIDTRKMISLDILANYQKCGVESGQKIHNMFENFISEKTGIKHINFKQLYEISKIHLIIVGTCLTTKSIVYFDHINTPTFKVSVALRISISIPGFFTPFVHDNKKYIDGGMLNNYPINVFSDKLNETIGILIYDDCDTDYKYPEEYIVALYNLIAYKIINSQYEEYKDYTICVKNNNVKINLISFNVDSATKEILYNNGYKCAENFIKSLDKPTDALI